MSTTIDSRVVSMQFDNKHFEQNVATSMSTLDKLKQKLNLSGATKGLEEIDSVSRKVNMNGLGNSVETVSAKFSALQVMGVTALANITNQAVNAGKRMVSALTIDPITTGFSEYELKMNSIQTIMASTGESLATVNKYLEELNEYSDQTIYSFSDMTQNIGKFTNAGVSLEDAVAAIKGISNEAALSGANTNEASRAMYNFSQALSAGYVKLIDWKSIENANMATVGFKEELINTALELGTVTKAADGMYQTLDGNVFNATKNFNEVFQDQWMTSEVLIKTLKKYSDTTTDIGKKATAAATEVKTFTQLWDTLKESAQSGWAKTWELLVGDLEQAKKLLTGISKVVGGFIDRMSDWRNNILEGALGSPFKGMKEAIEGVLSPAKKVGESLEGTTKMLESIGEMAQRMMRGDFGNGMDQRLAIFEEMGWGANNYYKVQNKVNELMGDSTRYAVEEAEAQEKATEARYDSIESLVKLSDEKLKELGLNEEEIKSLRMLAEYSEKTGISIEDLSKDLDQLNGRTLLINSFKNAFGGLSQVFTALKDAWQSIFHSKSIEERSIKLYDMIAALHKFSLSLTMSDETAGKLQRTFKGVFAAFDIVLTVVGGPLKWAFKILTEILAMFDMDILDLTAAIGDTIVGFRDWLKQGDFLAKGLEKLKPFIMKIAEIISNWVNKIDLAGWFSSFVEGIKNATNSISNWIKGLKEADNIPKYILDTLVNGLKSAGAYIGGAFENLGNIILDQLKKIPGISKFVEWFMNGIGSLKNALANVGSSIGDWFAGLKETDNIPKYIFQGLITGLKAGISSLWNAALEIGKTILDAIKSFLGIHSPSVAMIAIGGFIIAGLIMGLKNGLGGAWDVIKNGVTDLLNALGSFDLIATCKDIATGITDVIRFVGTTVWNFIKAVSSGVVEFVEKAGVGVVIILTVITGLAIAILNLSSALKSISSPMRGFGDMLEEFGDAAKDVGKGVKNYLNSKALLNVAEAVATLALVLIALSFVEPKNLWSAIGAIAALVAIMAAMMMLTSKLSASLTKESVEALHTYSKLLGKLCMTLLLFAVVSKIIGSMSWGSLAKVGVALLAFGGFIVGFIAATKLLKDGTEFDKVGAMLWKIAGAMLIMVIVSKIAAGMKAPDMLKAGAAMLAFGGIVVGLMAATKLAKGGSEFDNTDKIILKVAASMLLMMLVAKLASTMSYGDLVKGALTMVAFGGIIVGLMAATKLTKDGSEFDNTARVISKAATAMLIMAIAAKIAGSMSMSEIGKGVLVLTAFSGIIVGLMAATKLAGGKRMKYVGSALLGVSAALAVMAISVALLGSLDAKNLVKGTIVVAALGGMMVGLIAATKLAGKGNLKNSMLGIAAVIAVLAVSLAVLAYIDSDKLVVSVTTLTIILGGLALVLSQAKNLKGSVGTLIALTVMIAALGTVMYLLSGLDTSSTLVNALALVALLTVMSLVPLVLDSINKDLKSAASSALLLVVLAASLSLVAAALKKLSGVENAISSTLALGILLGALSLVLVVLGKMDKTLKGAWSGIVMLVVLSLALYPLVGALALLSNVQNALTNALVLTVLLGALTGVLVLLDVAEPLTKKAWSAVLSLAVMSLSLLALVVVLKLMSDVNSALQNALALGVLLAALTAVMFVLAQISTKLPQALLGVLGLIGIAAALGILTLSMQGMSGVSWGDIGKGLLVLAGAFVVLGVAAYVLSPVASVIIVLAAALALIGLTVVLAGAGLQLLATGLAMLASVLSTNATVIAEGLNVLVGGLMALIPTIINGVGQGIVAFCNMLITAAPAVGQAVLAILTTIVTTITGIVPVLLEGIATVLTAVINFLVTMIPQLVELVITIVTSLVNAVIELLPTFAELAITVITTILNTAIELIPKFLEFVTTLVTAILNMVIELVPLFIETVTTVITALIDAVILLVPKFLELAVTVINAFLEGIQQTAPTLIETVVVVVSSLLTALGELIPQFIQLVTDVILAMLDAVNTLVPEIIATGFNILMSFLTGIRDNIGEIVVVAGEIVVNFINGIAAVLPSIINSAFNLIISFINGLADAVDGNYQALYDAVFKLITAILNAIGGFFSTIWNKGKEICSQIFGGMKSKEGEGKTTMGSILTNIGNKISEGWNSFKEKGKELMNKIKDGMEAKKADLKEKMGTLVNSVKDKISEKWESMKSAGKDLIDGFKEGVTAKAEEIKNAATNVIKGAVDGIKSFLGIKSPSRLFMKFGRYVDEGFVIGVKQYSDEVERSVRGVGETAANAMSTTLSGIADAINTDIDSQPTIRPVLDLTDVESKAGRIGGLLNNQSLSATVRTAGGISSMMNLRGQNGSNDDIISALDKLGDKLGTSSGDSYQINGVTYDDGSNIRGFAEAIIRQSRVARRV